MLWDRKTDGGFPETKELKNRVRNVIDPGRDMGHVDRSLKKGRKPAVSPPEAGEAARSGMIGTNYALEGLQGDAMMTGTTITSNDGKECVDCQ